MSDLRHYTYRKDCICLSSATSGKIKTRTEHREGVIVTTFEFYPGPVCDGCGTPWKDVSEKHLEESRS